MTIYQKIIYVFFFISYVSFTNCRPVRNIDNRKKSQSKNDSLIIDSRVKGVVNFLIRGTEDIKDFQWLENFRYRKEITDLKSSTVQIVIENDKQNYIKIIDRLRCTAFLKNDTLVINNDINFGGSGFGATIKYTPNKAKTEYREFYDVIGWDKIHKLTVEKQNISFDKSMYVSGDSLYGSIYSRMIDENKSRYYITGFFRAKVFKPQFKLQ